jgi:hypothetical protein
VQEVTVTYDASGLAPGDYRALLLVSSNDPDESQLTVPIHLVVADVPAELDVKPETINLGRRGQTLTCFLELTGGLDPATIDMASLRLNRVGPVPAVAVRDRRPRRRRNPGPDGEVRLRRGAGHGGPG